MFFKKARRPTRRHRPRSVTTQKSKTKSRGWLKWLGRLTGVGLAAAVSGASLFMIVFSVVYSQLPPIDSLTEYKPKVPLRVWSADGTLIGEYGEERRDFVRLDEIPGFVRNAVLAAEDNGFYEHSGTYRQQAKPEKEDTCSMCGNFCAIKNMNRILNGEIVNIYDE